jgi:transcription elongation factor GreA
VSASTGGFRIAIARRYNRRPCPSPRHTVGAPSGLFRAGAGEVDASAGPDKARDAKADKEVQHVARESVITKNGLEKLRQEVEYLTTVKRREVAERIKEAREFGDITENSEYDDAKNEQALLEQRIAQLEERLRRAKVIDESEIDTEVVQVGNLVHVKDQKSGESRKFQIVGSPEANPSEQKLSNESPIGQALLGHKRGEVVTVDVPRGPRKKLKITKIEAA